MEMLDKVEKLTCIQVPLGMVHPFISKSSVCGWRMVKTPGGYNRMASFRQASKYGVCTRSAGPTSLCPMLSISCATEMVEGLGGGAEDDLAALPMYSFQTPSHAVPVSST